MAKFVEGFADKLVVPEGVKEVQVFDDALPGFGVRKFATGAAVYFVKFAVGKQQRRKGLGRVVRGNLNETRLAASKILIQAAAGIDVIAETKAAAAKPITTLGSLVPIYLKARAKDLRAKSLEETTRYLSKAWEPLHGLAIDAITRREIVAVIDTMQPVAADRAKAALSSLFVWAIERSYVEANASLGIRARGQKKAPREHLSEAELTQIWRACGDTDFGQVIKLLILTGQRKSEIGGLRWAEIDLDARVIKLPPARCKNGRAMIKFGIACHIIPLSDQAMAIIEAVPRGDRDLVFGRSVSGFKGWSIAKQALDSRIAKHRGKPLDPWVIHHIRHAVTTHLNESRRDAQGKAYSFARPHVTEAITNHLSGHKAGIAGNYNHASYLEEKREALELWAAHIETLVTAPTTSPAIGTKPKRLKTHQTVAAGL